MNERERILALVREGIISTEEAIELLENAAKKHGKDVMRKEKAVADFHEEAKTPPQPKKPEEARTEAEKKDRVQLEKILEALASEISFFSSKVDEKTESLQILRRQIELKKERKQEIAAQDEMDAMTPELEIEAMRLDEELEGLMGQERALREEKRTMEDKMRTLKKEQLETHAKSIGEKLGNKEEWKETAADLTNKVSKVGGQLGSFISQTVQGVMENIEWKDVSMNVNVPGFVSTSFSHEFVYENTTATILDFQMANGNVTLEKGETDDIRVSADVKIYAKLHDETPLEAFEARSNIEVTEDQFTFHVPNKRVRANLIVTLPERTYDYVAFKMLNGNIQVSDMNGKDFYVKATNGKVSFQNVEATMLELDAVNGSVDLKDSTFVDVLAKLGNGSIVVKSNVTSGIYHLVNGDIKLSNNTGDPKRIEASTVNGTIKIAIPAAKSVELEARNSLGAIKNRLSGGEVLKQRDEKTNKYLSYRRVGDSDPVVIELKTTNGNVLLKDSDI